MYINLNKLNICFKIKFDYRYTKRNYSGLEPS